MKKTSLVLLSAFLSPYRSGAEAMVEEVSVRLPAEYDVTIVTGRYSRKLPKYDTLPPPQPLPRPFDELRAGGGMGDVQRRVRVIRVGIGLPIDKWLFPFLAPLVVRSLRPDIIHAVLETFAGLALFFCRGSAKKVLTLQTTNRTFLKKLIVNFPDIVTAISNDLARIAATLGRRDVIVIPNGIDLCAIREACAVHKKVSQRVLFVGRLEKMKGIDTLLCAFKEATEGMDTSVQLRIVGGGSQEQALKKLTHDLSLRCRVTFTGKISGNALFAEYAKASIFCGLSRSEALGNVFLEAQASGCAVLATNVGGIPDIVKNGETGVLVAPDDVHAAAVALHRLLTDVDACSGLSSAAQKHTEDFGWDEIAERYVGVLRA